MGSEDWQAIAAKHLFAQESSFLNRLGESFSSDQAQQ